MSKTNENLAAAFSGESQANRKYLAFAERAERDGKPNLARLFRVAAEGETVHALNHLAALGGVKTTKENLEAAIGGEIYEIEKMYPQFISELEEGEAKAKMSLTGAEKVEEIHQKFFQEALSRLEAGEDIAEGEYYVCPVCGLPALASAPAVCPVCGTPGNRFKLVQ